QNRLSMQPPPRTSVPLSDTVVGDGFSIRSSSPTSMYSTNSHHRQDSYESEAGHTKNNNINDTFMDDNNSLST
ncbi:18384_t:CDS:1, partial [Acaulospora morrowiae]